MRRRRRCRLTGPLLLVVISAGAHLFPRNDAPATFSFEDWTEAAGIHHFTVYGGERRNDYLLETTGCGAAFVDVDNDGLLDLFFVNGSRFEGLPPGRKPSNSLYRNLGDGRFEDATAAAGVGGEGWGQAVCGGDYDNDGYVDLFVTYWGQNVLYRNRGDGSFEDATVKAGLVQSRRRWNSGCAFLDYDRDGYLDLFVANYIDFEPAETPTPESGLCLYKGVPVACGPPGLPGAKNILYRNQGDGTFTDVSDDAGILRVAGTYGLGVLTVDFDNDGWPDIYVANDSSPCLLYRNNRDGTFTDIAALAGCAYSQDGKPQAGMGVAAADVNRDGTFDIFKTNFAEDASNLYLNRLSHFEEGAFTAGIGKNTRWLGWGCGLFDFDNDGWIDIFQVNGHVYPEVDRLHAEFRYRQAKLVYRNRGDGTFQDVSERAGEAVRRLEAGRGAAFGDFDNDGDIDVAVNNVNSRATLYRTDSTTGNGWLAVRLEGVESNRSGIGTRLVCRTGGLEMVEEIRSGGSYYSQSQLRAHFGLGKAQQVDLLEVRWPSGRIDRLENLAPNRLLHVVEGRGIRGDPDVAGPAAGPSVPGQR
ncbi:MAG: hypothetical protein Kow001_14580 [Acidobacteriota bacterium]